MKIALIMENSQAAKSALVESTSVTRNSPVVTSETAIPKDLAR